MISDISNAGMKVSSPISRVLSWTVIHLGPASPQASSNLPESSAGHAIGFLFGLAPGGVYHRRELLPVTRCALTAPFHPYRHPKVLRRFAFCCTFRRLAPPRRYLAPCPMEPGLSSPGRGRRRLSGELGRDNTPRPSRMQAKVRLSWPAPAGRDHSWSLRSGPPRFERLFSPATRPAGVPAGGPRRRTARPPERPPPRRP